MKKIQKVLLRVLVCALAVLMLVPTLGVSAESSKTDEMGFEAYTYWYEFSGHTRKIVPNKPMYNTGKVLTSIDLECSGASTIEDSHVSSSGITYVLDGVW